LKKLAVIQAASFRDYLQIELVDHPVDHPHQVVGFDEFL